jgi:hypothetical protein
MSFKFYDHSRDIPAGAHAILSPSKYSWTNYDSKDKLFSLVCSSYAQEIGTLLHELASTAIKYRVKIPKIAAKPIILLYLLSHNIPRGIIDVNKYVDNFCAYVNDAIGFDMTPEQPLVYSKNAFGTADAIRFNEKKMHLRIHDYKSGVTKPCLRQLELYAAYFCLEYRIKPKDLTFELRIYWENEIIVGNPTAADIVPLMDKTIDYDNFISSLKGD